MIRTAGLLALMAMAPLYAQQPKFEVADVHASAMALWSPFKNNFGGVLREGRYTDRDATLLNLIAAAYGVKEDDIAGGPGWVGYDLFDVVAKVPEGTTPATAKLMLQALLADRFGLVVQNETRPVPKYTLTIAKGGSKLKASDGSGEPGCKLKQQASGGAPNDPAPTPNYKVACHNLKTADIARFLRYQAGLEHEVVDSTKLDGSWDFDLEWTATKFFTVMGAEGISIFDAVNKQLGLNLEVQNVPMPVLAIEKVNRKPTANPPAITLMLNIPPARFEVAAIKLADPGKKPMQGLVYANGSRSHPGGTLVYRGGSQMHVEGTVRDLICTAFQIPWNVAGDMVIGLPKSADSQHWDILAKIPGTGEGAPDIVGVRPMPPPVTVAFEMLHGLLIDQFELKTHQETREVTVYALTVRNGGPKMTQADDSDRAGCIKDPYAPKPFRNILSMSVCKNQSMAELAQYLQFSAGAYVDHPIVDATGLKGGWNFSVGWTLKALWQNSAAPNADHPPGAAISADPGNGTVFDAVEKELNLKLVKQKRSVPVIVVDHVDEKPIE